MINLSVWQEYVERRCGFVLPHSQQSWLSYTIESLAKAQGMDASALYVAVCRDKDLEQTLFDKLLISESRFFRHQESVDFVLSYYEKQSMQGYEAFRHTFRVWSAGCSAGQEVYSVAMALQLSSEQRANPVPFMVVGSDLSKKCLQTAISADYVAKDIQSIPNKYRHYLQSVDQKHIDLPMIHPQQHWQVVKKISQKTHFFWQNLFLKPPVNLPLQDVILCQNVLIYFRKFDQRDILNYLVQSLSVGGYLVLAPSEVMFWQHPKMKRVEHHAVNAWQKIEH